MTLNSATGNIYAIQQRYTRWIFTMESTELVLHHKIASIRLERGDVSLTTNLITTTQKAEMFSTRTTLCFSGVANHNRMSSTVRVSNLPTEPTTVETVQQLFESFGNILQLTQPSSSSSYLDIQFQDIGDAQEAVNNMEGFELFGKYLHVSKIKENDDTNASQNDKKPVWEQVQ